MLSSKVLRYGSIFVLALSVLAASSAEASLIIIGSHTDSSIVPGGSLADVRLKVDLEVNLVGGQNVATITFENDSQGSEASAVFKTICIDLMDDDDDGSPAVLGDAWDVNVRDDLSDRTYTAGAYNVLPGYGSLIEDGPSMIEFNAADPPPFNGIGPADPNEKLVVEFHTSLTVGADIFDYLTSFDGGNDTQMYAIGFHAISADVVDDESLSGVVPEPASVTLLLLGFSGLLLRRKRR